MRPNRSPGERGRISNCQGSVTEDAGRFAIGCSSCSRPRLLLTLRRNQHSLDCCNARSTCESGHELPRHLAETRGSNAPKSRRAVTRRGRQCGRPRAASPRGLFPSDDKAYTPIARSSDRYRATPLYYSMLMFAQVARGAVVPTQLAPDTSGLKAFAVRAPEGTLRVCLINQNITHDERLAIDPGRKFTAASMLRLTGPAIHATARVTLVVRALTNSKDGRRK